MSMVWALGLLATAVASSAQAARTPTTASATLEEDRGDMLSDIELTRATIQVRRQALVMGFSDSFAVVGIVLVLAAIAILLTGKPKGGAAAPDGH